MSDNSRSRELACGEANAKIHWGAEIEDVLELLRTNYGIEGAEADAIVSDAVRARRSAVRKKAWVTLVFCFVGLAIPVVYFAIQGFAGFVVIGFGPVFMALLGLTSLSMAGRSVSRLLTGKASGPV